MLYKLAEWINAKFSPPGFDVFRFLTFRSAMAAITALLFCFIIGPKIINILKKKQIGEAKKEDGPKFHWSKAGTPTMGGFILLLSVLIPVLLWGDLSNTYVLIMLFVTISLGAVGFLDDYLKVIKKYKKGLVEKYKLLFQLLVGLTVAALVYFLPEFHNINSVTTIPFLKNYEFDFSYFYIPIVVFIIVATSNAVNLTDGLDGLATGTVGIVALTLGVIAYVSGNVEAAKYLNIIYGIINTKITLRNFMVRWMSGRSQLTANESISKGSAGSNPALTEKNPNGTIGVFLYFKSFFKSY